jgi:hypothetical protein
MKMSLPLTKDEAQSIAEAFRAAEQSVKRYMDNNYNQEQHKISRADYDALYEFCQTLLCLSSEATTVAVGLSLDALTAPANELNGIIEEARQQIKTLQNISMVINCVSGLVNLASSLIAREPGAIVTSINKLRNQISM